MVSAFEKLASGNHEGVRGIRGLQVGLQAELLRGGAYWEESLAVLREMTSHGKSFRDGAEALSWYRSTYHPAV